MSDRISYRRLVNLGDYEHLLIEVAKDVPVADGDAVKELVRCVDRWASKACEGIRLDGELRSAQSMKESIERELNAFRQCRLDDTAGEDDLERENIWYGRRNEAIARVERIEHEITGHYAEAW